MTIRVEHGKPSTLLTAAQMKGEARKQEEMQKMQMEFDYRQSLRQQDMVIDLQMQERAKQWEIDKMQLRSQIDFQREEQVRQRKLDSIDSAVQQIDKEVLAGRLSEEKAYPLKQKLEISKLGINVPVSAFPGDEEEKYGMPPWWTDPKYADTPEGVAAREKALVRRDEEDRYGVRPYYLEPEFERDYPELAEAKKKEVVSGQRRGTVPYYLDPAYIRTNPAAARQAQEARGIFLSDEEFDDLIQGAEPTGLPLADKQLDVGVRSSIRPEEPVEAGRIRVISPEGQSGTILESERQDYIDQGFTVVGEAPAFRGAGATGTWGQPTEEPKPKKVKRKPTIGNISWSRLMSKGFK